MDTDAITIHLDDELAKRLKVAAGQPVVIEHNGVRYRIEPEDPFAFYDPKKMRAALRASAGARCGVVDAERLKADIRAARGHGPETDDEHRELFRRIVREAKPEKQPTEYGPESRYGRDSYSNGRYNDALDEYEDALLKRIDSAAGRLRAAIARWGSENFYDIVLSQIPVIAANGCGIPLKH